MQVASGGRFFPFDPRPEEVHLKDIAVSLAYTCRYGGHCGSQAFYSVAEHSLLMAEYAMQEKNDRQLALLALMHDASEAYTGDLVRAVKYGLDDSFQEMENKIQEVIFKKFHLWEGYLHYKEEIHEIDMRITVNEKKVLFPGVQTWATDSLDPLPGIELECLSPEEAEHLWLQSFFSLTGAHLCF